jgi:translocation and assembly module TamB
MPANDPHATGNSAAPSPNAPPPEARRRRRLFSRRNALVAGAATLGLGLLVALALVFFIRTGRLDRIVADQVIATLAEYGVRAEVDDFHIAFSPRTVEIKGLRLYDAQTGAQLGKIDRLLATVRIEDLFALNLRRNVDLEKLQIDNPEVWVTFDAQGNSNFRYIHLPPKDENKRILFSYSTAQVSVNNALIHYGDELHKLSGEARSLNAFIEPDDPNAPAESAMNRVTLALSNSTFSFDDRQVNNIRLDLKARVNQNGAQIEQLNLQSPLAEAQLSGTLDDWRALRYHMNVTSNVNLTQAADIISAGSDLRGSGRFIGTVEGEGVKYTINGQAQSDSLVAEGVRLQGLNFTGSAQGESASYEVQGRAVADLLASGDFKINALQLAGKVTGTGTDFRWLGALSSAGLRQGNLTIGGLIASDALAEVRDQFQRINGTARRVNARNLTLAGSTRAQASDLQISDVRFAREPNGAMRVTGARASAGNIAVAGARVGGAEASSIVMNADGTTTRVNVADVRVGSITAAGAQTASINIAGVRLSINKSGRIEGATNDVNVGAVALNVNGQKGKVEDVRVAHPVLVVEPSGRYRASADLSLGGGVLGSVELGRAESHATVTNSAVTLDNLRADVMQGEARGQATIALARNAQSQVNLNFQNLDLGKLLALALKQTVPVVASTSGSVNVSFPSTDFALATGTLNATFDGMAGGAANGNNAASPTADNGRTPLTGELAVRANRGAFQIERAQLNTAASQLSATGQFSFSSDSNLQVNLASNDAGELQRLVASFTDDILTRSNIDLAGGKLNFKGAVRGRLSEPNIAGNLQLAPFVINNRDLGALTAAIDYTPALIRIDNGRLTQTAGGAQFSANIPLNGTSTGTIDAVLDRVNVNNLANAVGSNPYLNNLNEGQFKDIGAISGRVQVAGIPNNLSGSADVRASAGSIEGVQYNQITLRASFSGNTIKLDNLDAQLDAGRISANGTITLGRVFGRIVPTIDLHARGENVNLALVNAIAGNTSRLPKLSGTADFTADISTPLQREKAYDVNINAQGRNVRVNGVDAGALTLVARTENQRLNAQLTTGLLGQPQTITARVDLSKNEMPAVISTTLANADLTPLVNILIAQYKPNLNVRVTGRANGAIRVEGNLENLSSFNGRAEFNELGLMVEDVALNAQPPLVITFSPDQINFEQARFVGAGTNVALSGSLALSERSRQNFAADGDINLRVLNALDPNSFFNGTARVQLRVTGTRDDPRATGMASLTNASFSTILSNGRLNFNNINGTVRFAEDRAEISSLTGTLGTGRVYVGGGAVLSGFAPREFRLTLHGDNVSAPLPYGVRGTGDVDLVFQGGYVRSSATPSGFAGQSFLTGTVSIRRAEYTEDIDIADFINRRNEPSLTMTNETFGSSINLDLQVSGRDALFIRNNLADAVGSAALQITGTVEDPLISGRFNATRGVLLFRNERYEITRALIDLQPDADPIINFQGEADIKGYRVIVTLNGPLSQLQANVRSNPALPQADVIALITTGDLAPNTENSSVFSSAGLGTATSLVADALINAPVQRATDRLFGLNRFEIDPLVAGQGSASPTARLTIGRQINRNLSVTYSTNVTSDPNPIVAVEYRVSDRLSFVAQYEQRSNSGLRSQNNNFSFEVRLRKRF